jgi:hypothetical protein
VALFPFHFPAEIIMLSVVPNGRSIVTGLARSAESVASESCAPPAGVQGRRSAGRV